MSEIVDAMGLPIGRVGDSTSVNTHPTSALSGMNIYEMERAYNAIEQKRKSMEDEAALTKRVHVSSSKLDTARSFWRPYYFDVLIEGRHLNGIEAYELGDPEKTPAGQINKSVYIAMCNLMAIEGVRMMGEKMPTSTDAILLAFATKREKEIADFWKKNFAPTEFQVEWAWKAALAVMAGDPVATRELLEDYRDQLV